MSLDTRGRRATRALLQAAERRGPPPDLGRLRRRRRRRTAGRVGLAVAAGVVAVALVGQALPLDRIEPSPRPPAGATATTRAWPGVPGLDGHVRDAVATGKAQLAEVAAGPGGVWVLNRRQSQPEELVRVDPSTDQVVARIDVDYGVTHLAVGEDGSAWLYRAGRALDRPELVRVDAATNRIADVIDLPAPPAGTPAGASALLVAGGSVWLAFLEGQLLRLDPASRELREVTDGGASVETGELAFAGGSVWAARGLLLHRIDPDGGAVTETVSDPDRNGVLATGLAAGAGGLWLLGTGAGPPAGEALYRLDPATGRVRAMVTIGSRSGDHPGVAAAGDRVVAVRVEATLYLVDPAVDQVRAIVPVPRSPRGLAVGPDAVWVSDPANGRLLRVDPGF